MYKIILNENLRLHIQVKKLEKERNFHEIYSMFFFF